MEEARDVICQLPKLSLLSTVIQGQAQFPPVALPKLTSIKIEFESSFDWLQGFRGASLGRLEWVCFRSNSSQIGDFLGEFESVALTTSAPDKLSSFKFLTSHSWNPNYSSLLSFKQLKELEIEFSCNGGCSSTVDDNIITTLAQAMPKLETLKLGGAPCRTTTGATVKGLIILASHCPHLSKLRIHFQAVTLADAATSAGTTAPPGDGPAVQWEDCVLTDLEVGNAPVTSRASMVALTLLGIFPHISNVKYINSGWESVAETVKKFRQIHALVHRGEVHCHA